MLTPVSSWCCHTPFPRACQTFLRMARPAISHSARAATKIFKSHRSVVSGHCQRANRVLGTSKSVQSGSRGTARNSLCRRLWMSHGPPLEPVSWSTAQSRRRHFFPTGLLDFSNIETLHNLTLHRVMPLSIPTQMSESGFSSPYKPRLQLRLPQGTLTLGFAGSSCVNSRQRNFDASEVFLKQRGRGSVQQIAHLLGR